MFNKAKTSYYKLGAVITTGALIGSAGEANAAANNFSTIATNIASSIASLPGLISALAYLFGTLLAVLGVMKIKDHVENPTQTPLKDGAIRLLAGGALFAIPLILDAMFNTIGSSGAAVSAATLKGVSFTVN